MPERPDFERVLLEHADPTSGSHYQCGCGEVSPILDRSWISVWHRTHLAAALNAEVASSDDLRGVLADFAKWQGESDQDAEWAAETYLHEVAQLTGTDSPTSTAEQSVLAALAPTDTTADEGDAR